MSCQASKRKNIVPNELKKIDVGVVNQLVSAAIGLEGHKFL